MEKKIETVEQLELALAHIELVAAYHPKERVRRNRKAMEFCIRQVRRQALEDAAEYMGENGVPRTSMDVDAYYAKLDAEAE